MQTKVILTVLLTLGMMGCSAGKNSAANETSGTSMPFNIDSTSIVGGELVQDGEPIQESVVALYDVSEKTLCSGSILTDSVIITAAHCLQADAKNIRVIFGRNIADKETRVVRSATNLIANPKYAQSVEDRKRIDVGDIGLLKFAGGLPSGYKPATLLSSARFLRNDLAVVLAGYGITNGVTHEGTPELRKVTATIEKAVYGISEVLLDQRRGNGACHGDSGGPAYVTTKEGKLLLFGITSRGVGDLDDSCLHYSAYTNILSYTDWIQETLPKL